MLAVIDRIGELIQALETGEALASEDDEQLIAALNPRPCRPHRRSSGRTPPEPEAKKALRSIRLSVDLLDRMMSGVSDAVLARNELARRLRDAPRDVEVEAAFERVSACIAEIRDGITRTRMQRIDSLFAGLPRMVRDLAAEFGKQVQLQVDGGDVELDREMIEMIRDPLTHIVRNAIDHGIETPEERAAAGKAAVGDAQGFRPPGRQPDSDRGRRRRPRHRWRGAGPQGDGGGPDHRRAGREDDRGAEDRSGLHAEPFDRRGSDRDFRPRRRHGRGPRQYRADRRRGRSSNSRPSQGVRLCIRVPLTLTIIPALTVSAGGQVFAIPRSAIDEILRAGGGAVRIERVGEAEIATIRGRRVPLVALADLLGVEAGATRDDAAPDPAEARRRRRLCARRRCGPRS